MAISVRLPMSPAAPGLLFCTAGTGVAWLAHRAFGPLALPTAAVLLGVLAANLGLVPEAARPGSALAARRLMRAGIVLLGLQVSVSDIAGLGPGTLAMVPVVVAATLLGTWWLGRRMGLNAHLALLVAAGFAVCGASAVAAVNGACGEEDQRDTVTAIALVTLCGTLAIGVLPALRGPLGLSLPDFGRWTGASVHDVGQVVAAASAAGPAALAPAVAVKLIRVALLAPIAAGVSLTRRTGTGTRPPLVPLFVAGFLAMIAIRATGRVPQEVLVPAGQVQGLAFGAAMFGAGSAVRIGTLLRTGRRALVLGLCSWLLIAAVAYAGVKLT